MSGASRLRSEFPEVVSFREEELSTILLSESLPIPGRSVDGGEEQMLLCRLGASSVLLSFSGLHGELQGVACFQAEEVLPVVL